jgi:hypothetical protein
MLVSGFGGAVAGDAALVDGVADVDIAVAIAVGAHVARRREAGLQVGLQVLHGDERRGLPRHAGTRRVEHVRMGVDHSRQHRRLAEIDHPGAGGNLELRLRPDIGDALALQQHHLLRQHLAGLAVEQLAGADRHHLRRRHTFIGGAVGSVARRRARAAPRLGGPRPFLRERRNHKR